MPKNTSLILLTLILFFSIAFVPGCDTDDSGDDDNNDSDDDDDNDTGEEPEAPDPLVIVPGFLPIAQRGESYETTFEAEGGTPPYHTWRVSAGIIPVGMALDWETGILSGDAQDEENLHYFVVEVSDSSWPTQVATEAFGLRVGDPETEGPLSQKARAYQEIYLARHNLDGLSVNAEDPDNPDGLYVYGCLGDACFVHGNASAGAAYRYAVEQTEEALENVRLHVRGLDLLNRVNGVPGLLCRSYIPAGSSINPRYYESLWPESDNHRGEGEFADYFWKGDVSKDQYSGELVGLAMTYLLVDDEEVRQIVRRNIEEIADYLWDNGLIIYDSDGEPTRYGDFRGEWLEYQPIPDGLGAAASLAWFKLASIASDELRFKVYYDILVEDKEYPDILSKFMFVFMGYELTKNYNVYMASENMFVLTLLEEDPDLKAMYADAYRKFLWESTPGSLEFRRVEEFANPTLAPWYLESTGNRDPVNIMHSIWQMDVFVDAPLRDRYIENSSNPDIVKNPEWPAYALYPLPANLRKPDMCIWHRGPYDLDGGADNGNETTGHDYMLPYWMGRYYGYISEDW